MKIIPPCRVYFYHKGSADEQYVVIDVDAGDSIKANLYRMQLVEMQLDSSIDDELSGQIRSTMEELMVTELPRIEDELNAIDQEVRHRGWSVRVLPLENNTKRSFLNV